MAHRWGFPEKSTDVRLAQYETGTRTPKAELASALADVLGVSPQALFVPNIDSYTKLLHTLFALEDIYGLTVGKAYSKIVLQVNVRKNKNADELHRILYAWQEQAAKLEVGETTKEDYDN